jgi:hypothetical protein
MKQFTKPVWKFLNRFPFPVAMCIAAAILCAVVALSSCSSPNAASTTAATLTTVKGSADAAMTAWGAYVAAAQPGTNEEQQVYNLWRSYKSAELAALEADDAWLIMAQTNSSLTTPTNVIVAQAAESAALQNLIALIASFGVTNLTTTTH